MNQGFGSSSMTITYVTRRGTNRFSGRLYEGFRAQFLDAKNWGSTVKPKYHRNDFGASLGGPIMKDKLFFFASMAALDVPGGTSRTQNFLVRRREAGRLHLRQRRSGESLQYLCRAQRGERHVVPCVRLADQSDDGRAHRGRGRLSAECRRPGFAVGAADRSESAHLGVDAREFESDLLPDDPGGFQPVGALAPERGDQPDETGFALLQRRFLARGWPRRDGHEQQCDRVARGADPHVTHPDQRVQGRVAVHGPVVWH